ncbi:MAG: glycosyltransferase [Clostridia bacterium]|nr:glycosyltransferase [Clostridia bacterium]
MISIIIPVYNVVRYIRQTLESVAAQTYADLEVILVDDGSTDGSGGICDEFAAADRRFKVFHTANRGVSAARNLGLDESHGEYVGWVDADDWTEPEMFRTLLRALNEADADISVCAYRYEYLTCSKPCYGGVKDCILRGDGIVRALAGGEFGNVFWNKLFRRRCWDDVRFPVDRVFEDVAVLHETALTAKTVVFISDTLYHYRKREESSTTVLSMKSLRDRWLAYSEKYERLAPLLSDDAENALPRAKMRTEAAYAAVRPSGWFYGIPKKDRDPALLKTTSAFLKNNFRATGEKGWSFGLRFSVFASRRINRFPLAALYLLNRIHAAVLRMRRKTDLYP